MQCLYVLYARAGCGNWLWWPSAAWCWRARPLPWAWCATVDAAAQGGALSQQITGAQDVATFLQGYGVEVDPTTAEVSTVTVPRKWDDNFKAFNEVIKESGLDLSRVKNKKVDKWVVLIPAQSTETQKSYGVVLVYKNEARGAYILQKPSGEVLPLKAAAPTGASLALTAEAQAQADADAQIEPGAFPTE